jgi:hypothetical protein
VTGDWRAPAGGLRVCCHGLKTANLTPINLRIRRIALALADNASRVGTYSSAST